jgi:hypothetical protein
VSCGGGPTAVGHVIRLVGPGHGFCLFCSFLKSLPRAIDLALGIGLFAGPAVLSALCRTFPLGTGCAESKGACAEGISLSAKAVNPVVSRHFWPSVS